MPRNKSNRGSGIRGGRGGNRNDNSSNWSSRGGRSNGSYHTSKRGGRHNRNHHRYQNPARWTWNPDHYHGDAESTVTGTESETDTSDYDFIDTSQFPRADNDVFSSLLLTSPIVSGNPMCLRHDCKRAKKDLDWIRKRDRRLRRALRCGLEYLGTELVDFLLGGSEDEEWYDDDDAESMDWVPEPTVNLIMASQRRSESAGSPHIGLGIHGHVSPCAQTQHQNSPQQAQPQQQSAISGIMGPVWDLKSGLDVQGQVQTHIHSQPASKLANSINGEPPMVNSSPPQPSEH